MELRTVVSKRAYLLSLIYDLFHAPRMQENSQLYVYNMGDFSKALYVDYMLERRKLWAQAVREVIGIGNGGDARGLIEVLDDVNVFGWELIEEELRNLANRTVGVYNEYRDRIIRGVSKILGVRKYYERVYLIMGFNPVKGTYGSLIYGREPGYAVASVMVSPDIDAVKVVDLLLHELLHGLIRLNNVRVPGDMEEELVSALCPEGFLSNQLGLSKSLAVTRGRLYHLVRAYFDLKLHDVGVRLPDFIQRALGGQHSM